MSQIFAPGSVPGPAGAPGAAGAAGSLANVKSLTDNLLPNLGQLFDYTRVTPNYGIASDGTLGSFSGFSASPLIYCPGALYAITDIPIRLQGGVPFNFAYYDANGNFMSAVTSFSGITLQSGVNIPANTVFPLPGTQTYVRFGIQDGQYGQFGGGGNYASSAASASFYAGVTAPSLPGTYEPFGFDTVASVNAKVAAAQSSAGKIAKQLAANIICGGALGSRNAFNYLNVQEGFQLDGSGALVATSGWITATVFVPGATSAITNIPLWSNAYQHVCSYDAYGNFIADITSTWVPYTANNTLNSNTLVPLAGDQTYLKFYYYYGAAAQANQWVFYAGTTDDPPPSSLVAAVQNTPFPGNSPVTSVKYASELTGIGGNNAAELINAFLATASASNPVKLILDSMCYVTNGIVISAAGYTTIEGLGRGTGLNLQGDPHEDVIRVGPYTPATLDSEGNIGAAIPTRTATNIILRDFQIMPNLGLGGQAVDSAPANTPVSGDPAHALYGILLANCQNVVVENITGVIESSTYQLTLSNVNNVRITGCHFFTTEIGHDGIHIDGPAEDIHIDSCTLATHDDPIALNCPEGFGGDISRVSITNCTFINCLTIMRVYTARNDHPGDVHHARQITVSNCSGTSQNACFNFGFFDTADVDQLIDISVSNSSFGSPLGLVTVSCPSGTIRFSNITFAPSGSAWVAGLGTTSGAEFIIDGLTIRRYADANAAPAGVLLVDGSWGAVRLSRISVADTPGSSYSAIPAVIGASSALALLELGSIDMTHFTSLADSHGFTNVTTVRGSGVLGTGTSIPDSVMDNNVLYLSSNAGGAPSIKVGGTAKRLTLA
ncbi:MAG TPA: hypothetical protein VGU46_10970 [Acidobacteriaceae bacterium]|nr:hypothetical protein [Acidobacteriaceae bacterium]